MRKAVEVAKRAREFVAELRQDGFDERSILIGLAIAAQAAPVTKAMEDNPRAKRILEKIMPFVRDGLDIAGEIRQLSKGRKHAG